MTEQNPRGLEQLAAWGVSVPAVATYRGLDAPLRTEAVAWRAILADRRHRGIPISLEEITEARAAGAE